MKKTLLFICLLALALALSGCGGAFTGPIEGLTVTVWQGSYAEEYCRQNGLNYKYPDA